MWDHMSRHSLKLFVHLLWAIEHDVHQKTVQHSDRKPDDGIPYVRMKWILKYTCTINSASIGMYTSTGIVPMVVGGL